MDGQAVGSALQGERAASRGSVSGTCAQCGGVYRGRADKRFCTDACRTRHGREQKTRELAELVGRLQRLAGRA
jgi:hypothetical protein